MAPPGTRSSNPSTAGSLLAAIDFDINAVMWNWDSQQVMISGCVEAVSRKIMDFNARRVYDRALLAYRILLTHHKTRFWLSKTVFDWVKHAVDLEVLKKLMAILDAKLGRHSARAVMAEYDTVCRCKTYGEHLARAHPRQAG